MTVQAKTRLDELLVSRGLMESRARARDAILRGTVTVDGQLAAKPGQKVSETQTLSVDDPAAGYVSRAALKLIAGLDAAGYDVTGTSALDVGASTGGFTQVLLERGADHVIALDVGHGQLHPKLRNDPRVTAHEGLNARSLEPDHLDGRHINFIVSDVSFISLKLALPPALGLATGGARCVLLVKPQFEVGREKIGKNGIVAPADAAASADDLQAWLSAQNGWNVGGMVPSPITGGDGNTEYLLWGSKSR